MTVTEIDTRNPFAESLQNKLESLKVVLEDLREEMKRSEERHTHAIERLTQRLDTEMPIRERLASIEARLRRT
jgi:HAMP domain-containing protein